MESHTTWNEHGFLTQVMPRAVQPRVMGRPVIIYDSGVGGLSVARHFWRTCPQEDSLYIADNAWFPYGNKKEWPLRTRVAYIIESLTDLLSPRGILVACNTASTVLEEQTGPGDLPVVGVLPPIARAVEAVGAGKIALLATPATASRRAIHECIQQQAQSDQVYLIGSLGLVYLAEEKMAKGRLEPGSISRALYPLIPPEVRAEVRAVILGCTHFPLIQPELLEAFPNATHWIDPAAHASQRLKGLLPQNPAEHSPEDTASRRVILTGDHNRAALESVFAREGLTALNLRLPVFLKPSTRRAPEPLRSAAFIYKRPQQAQRPAGP